MVRRVARYNSESSIHQNVADYLKLQYPGVLFHTDFAAGAKMTKGQAIKNSRLQSGRGWPDLLIAHKVNGHAGLALELKKDGITILLKDGSISKEKHVQEQLAVLEQLAHVGFVSRFVVGFEQAKMAIDYYMAGVPVPTHAKLAAGRVPVALRDDSPF